jgi:hypothetical protein
VSEQLQQADDPASLSGEVYHQVNLVPRKVNLDVFKEGLEKANETMLTNAGMYVMVMAPDAIKQKYFADLFDAKISAIANKKAEQELHKLQLQNEREWLEIESKELRLRRGECSIECLIVEQSSMKCHRVMK